MPEYEVRAFGADSYTWYNNCLYHSEKNSSMKKIKLEDLKKRLEENNVKLIEVLDEKDYERSHIKGAINIPLKRIRTEAKKRFDKDEELIVYCSDRECTASPTAARKLEGAGYSHVYHFAGGKKEWKEAGLPME